MIDKFTCLFINNLLNFTQHKCNILSMNVIMCDHPQCLFSTDLQLYIKTVLTIGKQLCFPVDHRDIQVDYIC